VQSEWRRDWLDGDLAPRVAYRQGFWRDAEALWTSLVGVVMAELVCEFWGAMS
jgi:hypothetical protein